MNKFSPSLLGERVLISVLLSIQSIVSVSGRISPHNFQKFSKSPLQAYSFRCWFSNNPVITFLEGCFPSSFVAEVGIFFSILLFQWSTFYSFVPEALWCCSLHPSTRFCQDHVLFFDYPFNRSVVSSLQVLFILSSLFLPSTGVLPKLFVLVPCISCSNRCGFIFFGSLSPCFLSFNRQGSQMFLVPLC